MRPQGKYDFIVQDIALVILSVLIAGLLVQTGLLTNILTSTRELGYLGSFIAGMFFTSIFTTAPAIVTLGEIANATSIISTAIFGALGAVVGDLIIFRFIRDRFSMHVPEIVMHQSVVKRIKVLATLKYVRWLTFLLAGMLIASPLPDELGIGLLGFSHVHLRWFIPFSFVFNCIGIILIGVVAGAI